MTYDELYAQIKKKGSFLCVGLDTDLDKVPACVKERNVTMSDAEAIFLFNKDIIDATIPYAVAYKLNTAFYEAAGWEGIMEMERTAQYIRDTYPGIFIIADAKKGGHRQHCQTVCKGFL